MSAQRSLQRAHSSGNARPASPGPAPSFPSGHMPSLDDLKHMFSPESQMNALIGAADASSGNAMSSEARRALLAQHSAVARLYEQMQLQAQAAAAAASASQTLTRPAHTHSAQPQRPGTEPAAGAAADTNAARDATGPIDYSTSGTSGRRAAGKIWSPADLVSEPKPQTQPLQQPFPNTPNQLAVPAAAAACGPLATHCPLTPQSPFQRNAAFEAAGAAAAALQQQQQQQQQAGLELLQLAASMLGQSPHPQFDAGAAAASASASWPAWPPQQLLGLSPSGCAADPSAAGVSEQQLNLLRYLYLANVAMNAGAGASAPSDAAAGVAAAAQAPPQMQPASASPRQTGRESALSPLTPHTPLAQTAAPRAEPLHV